MLTALRRLLVVTCLLNPSADDAGVRAAQAFPSQLPVLPPLSLEGLPPPVRADLEIVYAAARSRPLEDETVGRLAMLLHTYEQNRSADGCYRAARQLAPDSFSWAYLDGVVQAELGDYAASAASFRQAVRFDSNYLPAQVRLAEVLMKHGELQESRAQYEALVREFPEMAVAQYGLGHVLSTLGDRRRAGDHYQRAVDLVPQFGAAHYALALVSRDLGESDRAQLHFLAYQTFGNRRPALADPLLEQVRSMRGTARDLITEAARLGAAGQFDASIAMHRKALERDPSASQAHVNLISLYGRTGRPREAEAHYRSALALGASLAEAHYNYGVLLASMGRHNDAADAFQKTLEVDPFHVQAHNNLGAMLAQRGKFEEAAAYYRQAIASDPQHRPARFNLGRMFVASGRYAEAVEQFQRILKPEDGETPRYMFALAGAYLRAGDTVQARTYGERALRDAERTGQTELASTIEHALQQIRTTKIP